VILLLGGEHGRELITSEVVFWLGKLLSGVDEELASWPAVESATAAAWQRGWAKGTLKEWADDLLKRVLFKARARLHACIFSPWHLFCPAQTPSSLLFPATSIKHAGHYQGQGRMQCGGWGRGGEASAADASACCPMPQIIPIENIQGRKAVEAGDLCMRKTAAGVDLNRNWEYAWTAVPPCPKTLPLSPLLLGRFGQRVAKGLRTGRHVWERTPWTNFVCLS
jgi:hypothetical protein